MQESMNDEAIMYYVHVPNIRGEVGVYPTLAQAREHAEDMVAQGCHTAEVRMTVGVYRRIRTEGDWMELIPAK